jgi:hypothetical protein
MQVAKPRPRTGRRLSYHAQNPHVIIGVDGRSQEARRYRDLVDAVLGEFGSAADPVAVRELAGLKLSVEITQAALVNGDPKARNDLVRLSNLAKRAERELRASSAVADAKKLPASLEQHLARRSAEKATAG